MNRAGRIKQSGLIHETVTKYLKQFKTGCLIILDNSTPHYPARSEVNCMFLTKPSFKNCLKKPSNVALKYALLHTHC